MNAPNLDEAAEGLYANSYETLRSQGSSINSGLLQCTYGNPPPLPSKNPVQNPHGIRSNEGLSTDYMPGIQTPLPSSSSAQETEESSKKKNYLKRFIKKERLNTKSPEVEITVLQDTFQHVVHMGLDQSGQLTARAHEQKTKKFFLEIMPPRGEYGVTGEEEQSPAINSNECHLPSQGVENDTNYPQRWNGTVPRPEPNGYIPRNPTGIPASPLPPKCPPASQERPTPALSPCVSPGPSISQPGSHSAMGISSSGQGKWGGSVDGRNNSECSAPNRVQQGANNQQPFPGYFPYPQTNGGLPAPPQLPKKGPPASQAAQISATAPDYERGMASVGQRRDGVFVDDRTNFKWDAPNMVPSDTDQSQGSKMDNLLGPLLSQNPQHPPQASRFKQGMTPPGQIPENDLLTHIMNFKKKRSQGANDENKIQNSRPVPNGCIPEEQSSDLRQPKPPTSLTPHGPIVPPIPQRPPAGLNSKTGISASSQGRLLSDTNNFPKNKLKTVTDEINQGSASTCSRPPAPQRGAPSRPPASPSPPVAGAPPPPSPPQAPGTAQVLGGGERTFLGDIKSFDKNALKKAPENTPAPKPVTSNENIPVDALKSALSDMIAKRRLCLEPEDDWDSE